MAVALIGFGFLLARLATIGEGIPGTGLDAAGSRIVGTLMLVCGFAVNVASALWYARFVRRYRHGQWVAARHEWLPLAVAVSVAALAAALVWFSL